MNPTRIVRLLPAILIVLAAAAAAARRRRARARGTRPGRARGRGPARPAAGIAWYPGDVDAAFAAAKTAGKPLFLYWGASGARPASGEIHDLQPPRVPGPQPAVRSRLPRWGHAQRAEAGRALRRRRLPDDDPVPPDGTEITRLPGGVNVERYAKILDVALADARPVGEALAAATGGGEVSNGDRQLLAYYDWDTDFGRPPTTGACRRSACWPRAARRTAGRVRAARLRLPAVRRPPRRRGRRDPLNGLDCAIARRDLLDALVACRDRRERRQPVVRRNRGGRPAVRPRQPRAAGTHRRMGQALDHLGTGEQSPADRLKTLRARVMLAHLDAPDQPAVSGAAAADRSAGRRRGRLGHRCGAPGRDQRGVNLYVKRA